MSNPLPSLSEIQIGYIRRSLDAAINFVSGPAPTDDPDAVRAWCQNVCAVDTLDEVGKRWGERVLKLGRAIFGMGMGDELRKGRPATPRNLLLVDLNTITEYTHAILCLAVDEAEGEDTFRRAQQAADLGQSFPKDKWDRAAEQTIDSWQIADILCDMLLVDLPTYQRFQEALRSRVERLLTRPTPGETTSRSIKAGEAFLQAAKDDPKTREALKRAVESVKPRVEEFFAHYKEYKKYWEETYGFPYPQSLEDWTMLLVRAGATVDWVIKGEWTLRDVAPLIEGYLQRLADEQQRKESRPVPWMSSSDHRLVDVGSLPPDLQAALNAAVYCSQTAAWIVMLIRTPHPTPEIRKSVQSTVQTLNGAWNECRTAILTVAVELIGSRDSPAWFGRIKESSAHEAALTFADLVLREVWSAADLVQWSKCLSDPSARMDPNCVVKQFEVIQQRFQGLEVPNVEEIVSSCKLETARAAKLRQAGQAASVASAQTVVTPPPTNERNDRPPPEDDEVPPPTNLLNEALVASISGKIQRQLLGVLNGKTNVLINDVLKAVYDTSDNRKREALLKAKDRLNKWLAENNTGVEVRQEGDTLVLSPV